MSELVVDVVVAVWKTKKKIKIPILFKLHCSVAHLHFKHTKAKVFRGLMKE